MFVSPHNGILAHLDPIHHLLQHIQVILHIADFVANLIQGIPGLIVVAFLIQQFDEVVGGYLYLRLVYLDGV